MQGGASSSFIYRQDQNHAEIFILNPLKSRKIAAIADTEFVVYQLPCKVWSALSIHHLDEEIVSKCC